MKKKTKTTENIENKVFKVIKRKCVVCGKDLTITVFEDRKYKGGHFFDVHLPKNIEYWECEKCYR